MCTGSPREAYPQTRPPHPSHAPPGAVRPRRTSAVLVPASTKSSQCCRNRSTRSPGRGACWSGDPRSQRREPSTFSKAQTTAINHVASAVRLRKRQCCTRTWPQTAHSTGTRKTASSQQAGERAPRAKVPEGERFPGHRRAVLPAAAQHNSGKDAGHPQQKKKWKWAGRWSESGSWPGPAAHISPSRKRCNNSIRGRHDPVCDLTMPTASEEWQGGHLAKNNSGGLGPIARPAQATALSTQVIQHMTIVPHLPMTCGTQDAKCCMRQKCSR